MDVPPDLIKSLQEKIFKKFFLFIWHLNWPNKTRPLRLSLYYKSLHKCKNIFILLLWFTAIFAAHSLKWVHICVPFHLKFTNYNPVCHPAAPYLSNEATKTWRFVGRGLQPVSVEDRILMVEDVVCLETYSSNTPLQPLFFLDSRPEGHALVNQLVTLSPGYLYSLLI